MAISITFSKNELTLLERMKNELFLNIDINQLEKQRIMYVNLNKQEKWLLSFIYKIKFYGGAIDIDFIVYRLQYHLSNKGKSINTELFNSLITNLEEAGLVKKVENNSIVLMINNKVFSHIINEIKINL